MSHHLYVIASIALYSFDRPSGATACLLLACLIGMYNALTRPGA